MSKLKLRIDQDATIHAIHDDALVDLYDQGQVCIARASDVEPDQDGRWLAIMRGPWSEVLGPFRTRAEALAAEVDYLSTQLFSATDEA